MTWRGCGDGSWIITRAAECLTGEPGLQRWRLWVRRRRTSRLDRTLNAIGILHVQGTPFSELSVQEFMHPISAYTRTNFLTAKAVPRYMAKQGLGVILTLSTLGARLTEVGFLGNGVASAAIEAFSRILAGELGAQQHPGCLPAARCDSRSGEYIAHR